MMKKTRALIMLMSVMVAVATSAASAQDNYPKVPEPMIFDMMRALGAPKGELEANVLGTKILSGDGHATHWAPEVEYTVLDGLALELELPFENTHLEEIKLGAQATLGSFNNGKTAHGVQYIGVYHRDSGEYRNSMLYMLGHRYNDRWSSMSMIGLHDIGFNGGKGRNTLLVNHSTFYNASQSVVLGLEMNFEGGHEGSLMVMPQMHYKLAKNVAVQFGVGGSKARGDVVRPKVGLRLIREF